MSEPLKGNINQVQYGCVSKWHVVQPLYASSNIYVHMFKNSKFNYNQYRFETI